MGRQSSTRVVVGVADHAGWAVLVTAARDGALLDRRRVELVEEGLPALPYHHPAQHLPIDEGVALVERVRISAEACAAAVLEALAGDLTADLAGIAMRVCPELPLTPAERITSYYAQTRADSVMYRQALATAAEARSWSVTWYDPKRVVAQAGAALDMDDPEAFLQQLRNTIGPPWQKDHRIAMAASIAAASG